MPAVKSKRRKKTAPKSETKSFLVYVPAELLEKLDERFSEEGFLSRSEYVRKILTEAMS